MTNLTSRECEMCGRTGLRLTAVKPHPLLIEPEDEDRWLCRRDRVIRRFGIIWIWIFHLGEGMG
jgi:hypothetical protein